DGVTMEDVRSIQKQLSDEGAEGLLIAPSMAPIKASDGSMLAPDAMLNGLPSVAVDGVVVAGGEGSVKALAASGLGLYYVQEAYKHLKPIVAISEGKELLAAARVPVEEGVILVDDVLAASLPLRDALMAHRVWSRDARANQMPA
ncbi:DJ-1/PfpI family protein, partial [Cobetia marina]